MHKFRHCHICCCLFKNIVILMEVLEGGCDLKEDFAKFGHALCVYQIEMTGHNPWRCGWGAFLSN